MPLISQSIRTHLVDYPAAMFLMVAPFRVKLGNSSPVALWLSALTRVTARVEPAFTDHAAGLVRVIRYWLHIVVDRAVEVISITAPSSFHSTGLEGSYYWVLAAAVLLTTSAHSASEVSAVRANLDSEPPGKR